MTTDEAYEAGWNLAKNMPLPDTQAVAKEAFKYEGEIRKAFLRGYSEYRNKHKILTDDDFLEPDEKY